MINYFSLKELEDIQDQLITTSLEGSETGSYGYIGGKDFSDLYSITEFIKSDLYYETFEDKLTQLFYSVNKNHIFKDGNKRSSLYFSAYFLYVNGYSKDKIISFIRKFEDISVEVASNSISKEELKEKITRFLNLE